MARRKKRNGKKKFIVFLILIIAGFGTYAYFHQKDLEKLMNNVKTVKKNKPKLKIVDPDSDTRPIAVMINNHRQARINHSGLQDAYIVYEAIVEGGLTRMMALYKDKNTDRIGSVRSSRHYFLDYAMENDAIYVHFGWSPQAESDIKEFGINNINGLTDGTTFFRDTSLGVAKEHTAFTSIEKIKETAKNKGYRMKTDKNLLLNYKIKEVKLDKKEGAMVANNIVIPYSSYSKTSYTYDADNKVYKRYVNDEAHIDRPTGNQYTAKNIIIVKVDNNSMDSYGRQDLDNIGDGEGYYITNGYAVPITWSKSSRREQTVYKYENGDEIEVNDGNTFIQIEPEFQNPTIN